jgi:hypothetical protein
MNSIEIPIGKRTFLYRLFEVLPAFLSYGSLILLVALSLLNPFLAAVYLLIIILTAFIKSIGVAFRTIQGYHNMQQAQKVDWNQRFQDVIDTQKQKEVLLQDTSTWRKRNHAKNLAYIASDHSAPRAQDIYQAVIIAMYNEQYETLLPTIQAIADSSFDQKRIMVVLAYEQRGGPATKSVVNKLQQTFQDTFLHFYIVEHPADLANEVQGKGGNITYAGKFLQRCIEKEGIDPNNVIITTLDSDNRPHKQYLSYTAYEYVIHPNRLNVSFQPIALFLNNIWDVPAPMRVIATGNSFWNIVLAMRPHMLRNFASHSQSMQTLLDTNFWSVRTIVEDGHQFWRTYFRYDGNHDAHPIMVPIYQDAVLSHTYTKTLKAQFVQVRRWAWGASDVAYVLYTGWVKKNKVPKVDLLFKTSRLMEGHLSWATAPLLLLIGAFIPLYTSPEASTSYVANQLPIVASNIQRIAMIGLFISIYLSIRLLPPKPPKYGNRRRVYMLLQWVYLPVTTIIYSSFAALYSQTRLILGRYLGKFDVTEKVVKK